MGDFIKTLTSLIGSIKAKVDGKIGILQKRIDEIPTETVLYTPQTLTEEQQKQVRDNIGAIDAGSMFVVITKSTQNEETIYFADKTYDEIMEAVANKIVPVCNNPVVESVYGPQNIRCIFRNSFYMAGVEYASFQSDGDEGFYEVLIFNGGKVTATSKPKIMTGATTDNSGTSGMVPPPRRGDNTKFLRGDGKWADVEGDLSLGITGAQVGQIAKITAVDTDGKPTKWEPVEMAVGGEREWEVIADIITTSEDVLYYRYDVPDKKELIVLVSLTPLADSTSPVNGTIAINGTGNPWNGNYTHISGNILSVKSSERGGSVVLSGEIIDRKWVPKSLFSSLNRGASWNALRPDGTMHLTSDDTTNACSFTSVDAIRSVAVGSYTKWFGVGSHIYILAR